MKCFFGTCMPSNVLQSICSMKILILIIIIYIAFFFEVTQSAALHVDMKLEIEKSMNTF